MKARIALAILPALLMAAPAYAETLPNADDGIILWRNFQLGSSKMSNSSNDVHVYFVKQHWLNPNVGFYFFYGTQGTAAARMQYKLPLFAGTAEDGTPTAPKLVLTGQAGYRAIGMGNSLATFSEAMREGPEANLVAAVPLGNGFTASANFSYAAVFNTTGPTTGSSLMFYGANLGYQMAPRTTVALGLLGVLLTPFDQRNTKLLSFHDLGPTLTFTQRF